MVNCVTLQPILRLELSSLDFQMAGFLCAMSTTHVQNETSFLLDILCVFGSQRIEVGNHTADIALGDVLRPNSHLSGNLRRTILRLDGLKYHPSHIPRAQSSLYIMSQLFPVERPQILGPGCVAFKIT